MTWPNLLSGLRLVLIPLFVVTLMRGESLAALVIFAVAGLTDLLDGIVARWYHQQSKLGAYLDPAADKLLLTTAYLMLSLPVAGWPQLIPFWVFVLVILRDLIIVAGALWIYLRLGYSGFRPLPLSKWNTAVQIVAVFLVLIADLMPAGVPALEGFAAASSRLAIVAVAVLTVVSGLEYAYRFLYRYRDLKAAVAAGRPYPDRSTAC
ncbi:MAG: CDP-alcohol phosphatidyltransferase family protein [Acidobacteria bacterium]|nr:MAG: CDP-alcohol phosphatidyltransferase family protein [Acidobacteriota bacterium]